uniref:Uncharacterized protein n=1 Tax=Plectus sambesii TaxID=2011161 RepID=A0A914XGC7_9BILA
MEVFKILCIGYLFILVASQKAKAASPCTSINNLGLAGGENCTEVEAASQEASANLNSSIALDAQKRPSTEPCSESYFTDSLSEATRQNLKNIWANETFGVDCETKNKAARKVILSVTQKEREDAFVDRYIKIYANSTLTGTQKMAVVDTLVKTLFDDKKYAEFAQFVQKEQATTERKLAPILKASSEAQRALVEGFRLPSQDDFFAEDVTLVDLTNNTLNEYAAFLLNNVLSDRAEEHEEFKSKCGIPGFKDYLPIPQQQELIAIWTDYRVGADCTTERKKTQKLLLSLPIISATLFSKLGDYTRP